MPIVTVKITGLDALLGRLDATIEHAIADEVERASDEVRHFNCRSALFTGQPAADVVIDGTYHVNEPVKQLLPE